VEEAGGFDHGQFGFGGPKEGPGILTAAPH